MGTGSGRRMDDLPAARDRLPRHRRQRREGSLRLRSSNRQAPLVPSGRRDAARSRYGERLLVLISAGKSKLAALDAATGAVRWEQEAAGEWTTYRPLVTGSLVIAGNDEKVLCGFDRATGKRRWCRPVGETPRGLGTVNGCLCSSVPVRASLPRSTPRRAPSDGNRKRPENGRPTGRS